MACVCVTVYMVVLVGGHKQSLSFERKDVVLHAMHYSTYFIPFLPIYLFSDHYIQTYTHNPTNLRFLSSLHSSVLFFSLRNLILCKFVQMWMMRDESSWVFIHTDRQTNATLKCNFIMHMHYNNVRYAGFCKYVFIFLI